MQIAINLSAREFQSTNHGHSLVTRIESILEETKLSPMQLVLEITESSFIKNYATTIPILNALRALGVQIACDDFGTGYSSLTYLKRLPIDILKIDKLFIDELAWNSNDVVIIRAILAIAKQLGIQVIAEGVESRLQVAILQDLGCTMIQGFYFSRPTNAEEVTRLLYDKKN